MIASNRDWSDAFLRQAREDFKAAKAVQSDAPSVFCMLMQMTIEKVAKAALLKKGPNNKLLKSHSAAGRLIMILKRDKFKRNAVGKGNWTDVFNIIMELERAHPALAKQGQPMLEYPWEDMYGNIKCPADDLDIVHRIQSPRDSSAPRLIKFTEQLISNFNSIF